MHDVFSIIFLELLSEMRRPRESAHTVNHVYEARKHTAEKVDACARASLLAGWLGSGGARALARERVAADLFATRHPLARAVVHWGRIKCACSAVTVRPLVAWSVYMVWYGN